MRTSRILTTGISPAIFLTLECNFHLQNLFISVHCPSILEFLEIALSEHDVKFDLAEYLQAMEGRLRDDIKDVKADNIMRHDSHEKVTKAHVDEIKEGQSKLLDKVDSNSEKLSEIKGQLYFLKPIVIGALVAFVLWIAGLIFSNTCQNVTRC